MDDPKAASILSEEEARDLGVQAASVFNPRTPIATREFFAGRWNQITSLADAVGQTGLHVVIYGERGVGKTSLANIVKPLIQVLDEQRSAQLSTRLVIKTNANSGDSFSSIWCKLFDEITWRDNKPGIGVAPDQQRIQPMRKALDLSDNPSIDDVRRIASMIPGSVFIIDEFDRAAKNTAKEFTDLMKGLSDFSVNCTVILYGVKSLLDCCFSRHSSLS